MHLTKLRCMTQDTPLQIDEKQPFFSWQIFAGDEEYDIRQFAFRITVRAQSGKVCWDSGVVVSDETLQICYQGDPLEQDTRYYWHVTSWISGEPVTVLSEESWFETGLMENGWSAYWIGYDVLPAGMEEFDPQAPFYCADDFMLGENHYYLPPAPYLRRNFYCEENPVRAKIYLTAQGITQVRINGKLITDERLIPGTADYDHVAWSKCYDVTHLLQAGDNAIGAILADGWYAGYIGLHNREWYGSKPRLRMQMVLTCRDGRKETVCTDADWKASYGAVLEADIFQGECIDARKELHHFSEAGFDDSAWQPVSVGTEHDVPVKAHPGVPIIAYEPFAVKKIEYRDEDTAMVNTGRIISGVLRITLSGKAGAGITIRHAEILNEQGELHLGGNRSARVMDTYICSGEETEVFEPALTYHGFQYARITGLRDVKLLSVEAVQIGSGLSERTVYHTSDPVINQVYDMCLATMLDNIMDNPTDVCARDERLGWGMEGDHSMYGLSIYGNMERFIRKWNEEIWSSQHEDGALEPIAPPLMMKDVEQFIGDMHTNYGVRMIYTLYKLYADLNTVRKYYDKMEKFFAYLDRNSDRNIRFGTSGDWLGIWESTGHSDVNHGYGDCSPGIMGTSHYAIIILMMAEMSDAIGKHEKAKSYRDLYGRVRKAFIQNYVQRDGTIRFGRQGDYVMGLAAGLIPEEYEKAAAKELRKMLCGTGRVIWKGGTVSTPYFLGILAKYGMEKEAVSFLSSTEYPSIAYMLKSGSGTVWERWDGIWEDGTIHPQVMNAMSHLGFTVVDSYLMTGLAGIRPEEPGYHTICIEPAAAENLEGLSCQYQTKSGTVGVQWQQEQNTFDLRLVVPGNTTAKVRIPCAENRIPVCENGELHELRWENGYCFFSAGSGAYRILTEMR